MHDISDTKKLPCIENIRKISQSLAMLDLILIREWEFRYFSFDSDWDSDEMMASMRNGEGDEYFLLFSKNGMVGKIFSRDEGQVSDANQILQMIPDEFDSFKTETAFGLDKISCCIWRRYSDDDWSVFPIIRKIPLLRFITRQERYYYIWAEEYLGTSLDVRKIRAIFAHLPLDNNLVRALNREISSDAIEAEVRKIGYPIE